MSDLKLPAPGGGSEVVQVLESGTARADRLAWIRAGIAALEARLDAHDAMATPEERAMLVTLVMSLEDALGKIEVDPESALEAPGPRLDTPVLELQTHLADVGGRLRTRVLSSAEHRRPSSTFLRIVPWATPKPEKAGHQLFQIGRGLTALGVVVAAFLVFEFLFTGLAHDRAQQDLLAAFKQQIQTTSLDSTTASPTEGSPVALIAIPRIGLNQVVVEGTSPNDLKNGPGHLRVAPLPGEFGNAVIAGRRTTYGAPFKDLDRLRPGDTIRVTTGQGAFVYTIASIGRAGAGQAEPFRATLDTRLTLITSDPAFAPSGRLVVVGKLAGTPLDVARRPPLSTSIDQLGLSGDPVGLILTIVFGQLLILAIWLTTRLSRRWPRPLTVMFATPTLLALSVLAFSNLDSILPGML